MVFVDARPRVDYEQNHVPGAILLNEDEFEDQIDPLLQSWDLTSPIVVYCGSRVCQASHAVADRLRDEFGLEPVYVMKGGWSAWQSAVASRR